MKICPKCGKKLNDNTVFCSECGENVADVTPREVIIEKVSDTVTSTPKTSGIIPLAFGILSLLAAIFSLCMATSRYFNTLNLFLPFAMTGSIGVVTSYIDISHGNKKLPLIGLILSVTSFFIIFVATLVYFFATNYPRY